MPSIIGPLQVKDTFEKKKNVKKNKILIYVGSAQYQWRLEVLLHRGGGDKNFMGAPRISRERPIYQFSAFIVIRRTCQTESTI